MYKHTLKLMLNSEDTARIHTLYEFIQKNFDQSEWVWVERFDPKGTITEDEI